MRRILTLVLALAAPAAAHAQAVTWTIDPAHSLAAFTVRHMLVTNVHGEFSGPRGTVAFDPKNVAGTIQVDAVIDARTINTRNPDRDADLKSDDFFNVAKYPLITFKSKRAQAAGAGAFKLVGDLTMHGITREVTLDVDGPTTPVRDLDGVTRIGASATTVVNRRDFGLVYNELIEGGGAVVSTDVRISIDLEIMHK